MREIREWLEANSARLETVAARCGVTAALVHLVAVLVRAGLSDDAIHQQLASLRFRLGAGDCMVSGADDALAEIRAIIDGSDDPARNTSRAA